MLTKLLLRPYHVVTEAATTNGRNLRLLRLSPTTTFSLEFSTDMKTTLILGSALGALMLAVAAPSFAAPTPPAPPSASRPGPGGDRIGRMGPGRMGRFQRTTPE